MCGIAGMINTAASADALAAAGRMMLDTLVHRGPDSEGVWINPNERFVLGHRRLAIQDLSELGAQPMFSHSRRFVIIFNGEIYNFRELADELAMLGHQFNGHSDTEVLLEAIEEWGLVNALPKMVGMFAFALWDSKEKSLHLCRDRVGEKPLYYGWLAKKFCFASELKAIEAVTDNRDLNYSSEALNNYVRFGYINAPHTIYQGVYKLVPGTFITLSRQNIQNNTLPAPTSYWQIHEAVNEGLRCRFESEAELVEQFNDLLKNTVRRQLIADVNVGTFLSGGIDSSLVSAVAQKESSRNIKTFTIGFHDKQYDESAYAEKIADHIGSEHQTIYVSSRDGLDVIPELFRIYDEPFADSSQVPTYLVSKIAREHVTVCLSGDGGDELFAGYNRYTWLASIWPKISKLPEWLRHFISRLLLVPSPQLWDRLYQLISKTGSQQNYKLLGLKLQKLAGLLQQDNLHEAYHFLVSYWNAPAGLLQADYHVTNLNSATILPSGSDFIEEAMYLDQINYLPGDNLAKVDRASMRVSLETRLPLLSHEILEYSWRVPMSMKVRQNKGKWLLRQVLDKYVPASLIDRPKMGFSVPVADWLRTDLKTWAGDLLFAESVRQTGIFQTDVLKKTWDEHISGKRDHSHRLWTVLMFLSWQDGKR